MTRIKRGLIAKKRRNKIYKLNKGFVGSQSKLFATANQQNMKAHKYAYNDRRKNKNYYRTIWITRTNSEARINGQKYSSERHQIKQWNVNLNRKLLAEDNLRMQLVLWIEQKSN